MKLKQKVEARRLRKNGFSINQITDILSVSKGSVSSWVRDINLCQKSLKNIQSRKQLGRERARESRLNNILDKRISLFEKCRKEILPFSSRDLWVAGLMLYAGEGRKVWDGSGQAVELTNSEPDIARVFINFLINVCGVSREKIKIRLFIYPDINLKEAQAFWSKELSIPLKQFQKAFTKQGYSNSEHKRKSAYGTAHVVVYDVLLYRKILGWLRAVYECNRAR